MPPQWTGASAQNCPCSLSCGYATSYLVSGSVRPWPWLSVALGTPLQDNTCSSFRSTSRGSLKLRSTTACTMRLVEPWSPSSVASAVFSFASLKCQPLFLFLLCFSLQAAKLNGKDAVHIICSLESEEKDEVLLALIRAFLSRQLSRGDMFYLW